MIKRKRKRNPLKDDKKLMRKVAEFLARAIEQEPDGITAYLLAAELVRRDSLYCEECHSYDIKEGCDWSVCYPEIYDLEEESTLDMAKEAAEELAEDLGIVDYVNVFRYEIQVKKYREYNYNRMFFPSVKLYGVNLSGKDLSKIHLAFADLRFSDFIETDLSEANLIRTELYNANLINSKLSKIDLFGANLAKARISKAVLIKANLMQTNLSGADLSGADLSGANLNRADLKNTNLSGADLSGADFKDAKITSTTIFKNAINVNEAIGLKIINPVNIKLKSKNSKMTK